MIHRLLGPNRPCARIIVFGTPGTVKQAHLPAPWFWWLMVAVAPFLFGFGPPQLVDREIAPTTRLSVGELRVWAEMAEAPQVSAESYMIFDMASGSVVYEQNSNVARAPASLTKLMTVLLVLERADLNATVRIESQDLVGGATMGLAVGDVVSVTDLLWGALLPSGNDAASVLARHVGGDVATFVAAMNQRAAELGLSHTRFANPHGLDAEGHVSSAADMVRLTQELWAFPLFRSMVGTPRVAWNGRDLLTTNEWLGTYPGATGVKTGTTDNAGECLIASVEQDGRNVLVVVMGSSSRFADAATLYEWFRARYSWDNADGVALSVIDRVYDSGGDVWFMQPTGAPPAILQHGAGVPPLRAFRRIQVPLSETLATGMQVGVLEWWAGTEQVGTQTLVVR